MYSALFSVSLFTLVVHQTDLYSILIDEPGFGEEGSPVINYIADFINNYADRFRTIKHGALHGGLIGGFVAMPIIVTNALFERKGLKCSFLNAGYWIVTLALMGGVLCQWG